MQTLFFSLNACIKPIDASVLRNVMLKEENADSQDEREGKSSLPRGLLCFSIASLPV
jgi:hypothetical protein